ncbi:hypothetical protein POTOM_061276 [Populus tomentosa]|uniref:Protein kinase domain-containing protein n=1 Tax=Populus tomentosa TaxID=118781 RepID=A0A8X7XS62_POPTO|nr:hypothetical protein POTOM_061276 [Populus tomentosa]
MIFHAVNIVKPSSLPVNNRMMENTGLEGQIPPTLFDLPGLQTLILRNNQLTSTLDIARSSSSQLEAIDMGNNLISFYSETPEQRNNMDVILVGNPVCERTEATEHYRTVHQGISSFLLPCISDQISSPSSRFSYPYTGVLFFRPPFLESTNPNYYLHLVSLMHSLKNFSLPVDSVHVNCPTNDSLGVYRGMLPTGQLIAIKRCRQGFGASLRDSLSGFERDLAGFGGGDLKWLLVPARVADFGLSKPMDNSELILASTQVKGTMGYIDPEYQKTLLLTEKSDVYGFGVVLLELVRGRKPLERGKYLVAEVSSSLDRKEDLYNLHELLDPSIRLDTMLKGLDKIVDLAMKCVQEKGSDRPTMGEVVKEIENSLHLAGLNPHAEAESTSASFEEASQTSFHHP